jgi:hypothetical protein
MTIEVMLVFASGDKTGLLLCNSFGLVHSVDGKLSTEPFVVDQDQGFDDLYNNDNTIETNHVHRVDESSH